MKTWLGVAGAVFVLLVIAGGGDNGDEFGGRGQAVQAGQLERREARQEAAQQGRARAVERREQRAKARRVRAEEAAALEAEEAAAEEPEESECDSNYTGACLDPYASDYDCEGGSGDGPEYTGEVAVVGEDRHGLDSDNDGTGCEPY